jgi:hypothetical protein
MNFIKELSNFSCLAKSFRILGISWCLVWTSLLPIEAVKASDLSELTDGLGEDIQEQIESLTEDDREKLKNAEISENIMEVANDAASDTKINWTENDREALKLLGYSDAEIDELSLATALDEKDREQFKNRAQNYVNKKKKDVESFARGDLIPGLASSVIGLAFSALLGLVVGFRCHNQPSGVTFAATAGAWVALELMIWKGYQIRKDDFATVSSMGKIPKKLEPQIKKAEKIIKSLESEFKKSGVQNFNTFLDSQKPKVDQLRKIAEEIRDFLNVEKDRQFGALRSIKESIELAAETSRKKARNAKIAAVGYTAAAGLAAAEGANLINAGGTCTGKEPTQSYQRNPVLEFLIPTAHAGFATVGDLDKIGIPIGGGLAAAYLGFKQTWGHQIYSTPTGRGITFLAMAGIAAIAAVKLQKAAKFLDQQAKEMGIFVNAIEEKFSGVSVSFPDGDALIQELKDRLLPDLEEIRDGLSEDAKELEDKIKNDLENRLAEVEGELNEDKLNQLINEETSFTQADVDKDLKEANSLNFSNLDTSDLKGRLSTEVSPQKEKNFFFDLFISNAWAKTGVLTSPQSCFLRSPRFLIMDENCQCKASKKCNRSMFPSQMKFTKKSEFGPASFQYGALVSRSSDALFWGNPLKGVAGFMKAGAIKKKMELNTRKVLTQTTRKRIDQKLTSVMIGNSFKSIRPGLKDFYKGSAKAATPNIDPRLTRRMIQQKKKRVLPPSSNAAAFKAGLRRRLAMAKALGNESLVGFTARNQPSKSGGRQYNYSKGSITKDASKDLFQVIKKRYLIIQSQGRLKL